MENINEKDPKNISLKDILIALLSTSTIHMFSRIFSTKHKILQFVWTLFGLLSIGFCALTINETITDYLGFKVSTSYQFYEGKEAELPTITFCNVNRFTTKESVKYIKEFFNVTSLSEVGINRIPLTTSDITNTFSDERKKKMGYNFSEMVISCKLSHSPCSEAHFTWYYDQNYGNCFRFNADRSKNSKRHIQKEPGYQAALELELFIGIDSELEFITKSEGEYFFISKVIL
jgi:hypothetical protein